jgi:hypothetical protein
MLNVRFHLSYLRVLSWIFRYEIFYSELFELCVLLLLLLLLLLLQILFIQCIHNDTETKKVFRVYIVAALLWLQYVVHVMLFPMMNVS